MSDTNRTITLNDAEQHLARYVAARRHQSNRNSNVVNRRVGNQSDELTDLEGIAAEIAFCKYTNAYPDLSVFPRQGGADCDLLGLLVDVKTTQYKNGHLLAVVSKSTGDAEIYALMVGVFPTYRFAGWVYAEELIAPECVGDMGHGSTYVREQRELRKELPQPISKKGPARDTSFGQAWRNGAAQG